jgi:hypothetical protein
MGMKIRDNSALLKYMSGTPVQHFIMFEGLVFYKMYHPMQQTVLDDGDYEKKQDLVTETIVVHSVCFAILGIVEHRAVTRYLKDNDWNMMWIETFSRYINIYMNQGLFFEQAQFFLYTIYPKKMGDGAIGIFARLDAFDLLMMFDILIFVGTLASLFVFLFRGTIPDKGFKEFIKLDEEKKNDTEVDGDFLSVNFSFKRRLAAMSCNAFMNMFVLYMTLIDEY